MAQKRLLVVTTAPLEDSARERVRSHAGEAAEVRVVAPASDVSPLQWLASDEDGARGEAADRAEAAAEAVEDATDSVDAQVGDTDPVQAIEDALREFPADEVLVVSREGEEAGWLEGGAASEASERFGVPVTQLVV